MTSEPTTWFLVDFHTASFRLLENQQSGIMTTEVFRSELLAALELLFVIEDVEKI